MANDVTCDKCLDTWYKRLKTKIKEWNENMKVDGGVLI